MKNTCVPMIELIKRIIAGQLKHIAWDMDGTLADTYGVTDWLPKLESYDPSPYIEAKPMPGVEMTVVVEHLNRLRACGIKVSVVTWLSKGSTPAYDSQVTEAKLNWLKSYNFPADDIHIIPYGTSKASCVKGSLSDGDYAIIFDDSEEVRNDWTLGAAIDPADVNMMTLLMTLANAAERSCRL